MFSWRNIDGVLLSFGGDVVSGSVPATVRGEVGGTVEDLIALRARVLDVLHARTAVQCERERIVEDLTTQATQEVADAVLDAGELRFRFRRAHHSVDFAVDVAADDAHATSARFHLAASVTAAVTHRSSGYFWRFRSSDVILRSDLVSWLSFEFPLFWIFRDFLAIVSFVLCR